MMSNVGSWVNYLCGGAKTTLLPEENCGFPTGPSLCGGGMV